MIGGLVGQPSREPVAIPKSLGVGTQTGIIKTGVIAL